MHTLSPCSRLRMAHGVGVCQAFSTNAKPPIGSIGGFIKSSDAARSGLVLTGCRPLSASCNRSWAQHRKRARKPARSRRASQRSAPGGGPTDQRAERSWSLRNRKPAQRRKRAQHHKRAHKRARKPARSNASQRIWHGGGPTDQHAERSSARKPLRNHKPARRHKRAHKRSRSTHSSRRSGLSGEQTDPCAERSRTAHRSLHNHKPERLHSHSSVRHNHSRTDQRSHSTCRSNRTGRPPGREESYESSLGGLLDPKRV